MPGIGILKPAVPVVFLVSVCVSGVHAQPREGKPEAGKKAGKESGKAAGKKEEGKPGPKKAGPEQPGKESKPGLPPLTAPPPRPVDVDAASPGPAAGRACRRLVRSVWQNDRHIGPAGATRS